MISDYDIRCSGPDQLVGTLSGGNQQKALLARWLERDPEVLLLDEPFAGIDPLSISDIRDLVAHLKDRGIGVLITDHNVRETLAITDRSYIIREGQILVHGDAATIASSQLARKYYLGEKFETGFEGKKPAGEIPVQEVTAG